MHVEIAGPSDIDTLAQLNQHVQALHLHAAPSHFKETTLEEVAEAYRDFLHQDGARGFIAYVEGHTVGYVLSVIRNRLENAFCPARTFVYVDQIAVDPGYQGQGVGRGLMEAVIRYAKESGIDDSTFAAPPQGVSWGFGSWGEANYSPLLVWPTPDQVYP